MAVSATDTDPETPRIAYMGTSLFAPEVMAAVSQITTALRAIEQYIWISSGRWYLKMDTL